MGAGASIATTDVETLAVIQEKYNELVKIGISDEEMFESLRALTAERTLSSETQESQNGILTPRIRPNVVLEPIQSSTDQKQANATIKKEGTVSQELVIGESQPVFDAKITSRDVKVSTNHRPRTAGDALNGNRANKCSTTRFDLAQNLGPVFTTDVLTDPAAFKLFTNYAQQQKIPAGVDMLKFWVEIDALQLLPSPSYTIRRLRKIYDKFLSPEAYMPVCVTGAMLSEIEAALDSDNISAGIYSAAQNICIVSLEKSVYPRFRESKLFQKMQEFCAPAGAQAGNSPEAEESYALCDILVHPAKLRFLKTFCMEALALENLLFYLEVEDCKRLPNLSFIGNKTKRIYERYCKPTSPNHIPLDDDEIEKEIQEIAESGAVLVPKNFYEIQSIIFDKISETIWPGFCRSEEYLSYSKCVHPEPKKNIPHHQPRRLSVEDTEAAQRKIEAMKEAQLIETAMLYPVEKLIPIKSTSTNEAISIQGGLEEFKLSPEEQLQTILEDPFAKKFFRTFMQKRGWEHYLAFCEEVEDFKLLPGIEYLQHSAKKIFRKYILPSAKLQVDMSTAMRDEIAARINNPSVDMFKKISARVRHGMLQDSLPRFVKSKQYENLRKTLKKQASSQSNSSPSLMTFQSDSSTPGDDGPSGVSPISIEAELREIDEAGKRGKLELQHLDILLRYQPCLMSLRSFLETQHCSENLMLWEEIEHFRRLPSYQIVIRSAKKIYDKFLGGGNSRRTIPIDGHIRERIHGHLENACRTTFDEVERECRDYMRNVVVPDFLDSRIFMVLVGSWAVVDDNYPAEMLRGEFEMAFLRHRFHLVQETRGMSRDASHPYNDKT